VIDYYDMPKECKEAWNCYTNDLTVGVPEDDDYQADRLNFCAGWNAAMAYKKPKKQKSTEVQLSLVL